MKYMYSNAPLRAEDDDNNDDDSRTVPYQKKKAFQHFEQEYTAHQVHFYISKEIGEPDEYAEMLHRMNMATQADIIFIHLNTPGGNLDAGVQIINAMKNCDAKVVTILEGMAYSLGTLIFLAGDEMIVNDHCMMMFHTFKGGAEGKGNEILVQATATVKWFALFAKKIYVPFLTEDEFAQLISGSDFWMHSTEIRRRLNKMIKVLKNEIAPPPKAVVAKKTKSKTVRKTKETPTDS